MHTLSRLHCRYLEDRMNLLLFLCGLFHTYLHNQIPLTYFIPNSSLNSTVVHNIYCHTIHPAFKESRFLFHHCLEKTQYIIMSNPHPLQKNKHTPQTKKPSIKIPSVPGQLDASLYIVYLNASANPN